MVCVEQDQAFCVIVDPLPDAPVRKFIIKVRAHNTVEDLYRHVETQTLYQVFELEFPAKEVSVLIYVFRWLT